jgi:hypothetical protein
MEGERFAPGFCVPLGKTLWGSGLRGFCTGGCGASVRNVLLRMGIGFAPAAEIRLGQAKPLGFAWPAA